MANSFVDAIGKQGVDRSSDLLAFTMKLFFLFPCSFAPFGGISLWYHYLYCTIVFSLSLVIGALFLL